MHRTNTFGWKGSRWKRRKWRSKTTTTMGALGGPTEEGAPQYRVRVGRAAAAVAVVLPRRETLGKARNRSTNAGSNKVERPMVVVVVLGCAGAWCPAKFFYQRCVSPLSPGVKASPCLVYLPGTLVCLACRIRPYLSSFEACVRALRPMETVFFVPPKYA